MILSQICIMPVIIHGCGPPRFWQVGEEKQYERHSLVNLATCRVLGV